jgi:hypothetical protein
VIATSISAVLVAFATTACAIDAPATLTGHAAPRAPAFDREGPAREDGSAAVAWNDLAYQLAFAEDKFLTFKGHRAFAMMHLAMHDALNTIRPVHGRYAYSGDHVRGADPIAAAAQAAYEVLISQYPGAKTVLDAELGRWLGRVNGGPPKQRGIALGRSTATAILAMRQNDGWDVVGTYSFRSEPGQYQTTPDWNGFVLQPGFRNAKPFALVSPSQFRPPPPPELASERYASALNEVRSFGAASSAARTAEQTAYAIWWMEFAEGSVNRLARELVRQAHMDLWVASRLFAHLNMALFDVYIAVWDAKYEYNHWRPYTAVRQAANDGNAATSPDATWEPLRPTPPFPEYISAHAAGCAVTFDLLGRVFGDNTAFTMRTVTAPPEMPTRAFSSFTAAAAECADSRVRLGWHFRYSVDAGADLGRQVAAHVARMWLTPTQR